MPTEPLKYILDPDTAIDQQRPVLGIVCPLLRELVNNGTHVFRRCEATSQFDWVEALPPLLLYYHMLELADGIEVELSQACTNAAVPGVRSCFETFLQLKYLLAADHRRRSLQWHTCEIHEQIKDAERWDSTTTGGLERRKKLLEECPELVHSNDDTILNQSGEADSLRLFLQKGEFASVNLEYERLRKRKSQFDWFEMFDGPSDRRQLAARVTIDGATQQSLYDAVYRDWSGPAHGTRLRHLYTKGDDDNHVAYFAFRQPQRLKDCGLFTANFLMDATQCIVSRYRPGEDLTPWYLREVQPYFGKLLDLHVTVN